MSSNVGMAFYEELFRLEPETKTIFPSIQSRSIMFTALIVILVKQTDALAEGTMDDILRDHGKAHIAKGVTHAMFIAMGKALLFMVEHRMDKDCEPNILAAWLTAYVMAAGPMMKSAGFRRTGLAYDVSASLSPLVKHCPRGSKFGTFKAGIRRGSGAQNLDDLISTGSDGHGEVSTGEESEAGYESSRDPARNKVLAGSQIHRKNSFSSVFRARSSSTAKPMAFLEQSAGAVMHSLLGPSSSPEIPRKVCSSPLGWMHTRKKSSPGSVGKIVDIGSTENNSDGYGELIVEPIENTQAAVTNAMSKLCI